MPVLFLLGDSTCAHKTDSARPETGWGECFEPYLAPGFEIVNLAVNGRSTEMAIHEGIFMKCFTQSRKGDWVIIQYGHNESKPEVYRRTTPYGTYQLNLRIMASNLMKKGVNVVFASSIARRKFECGVCVDTHGDYPAAMKALADELGIPFIEMSERTRSLLNSEGEEKSLRFFMNFGPGLYPNYPEGREDNTHLRPEGAAMVASLMAEGSREKKFPFVK